jgi:hypothetical protein
MQELNLPSYEFKTRKENAQVRIFDEVRKKYVALTPEEWVRQHFTQFMIHQKDVPAALIIMEKKLIINTLSRRPDILIHDRNGNPLMIIECKSPDVKISQDTFDQVARYNSVLNVPYIVVSNGIQHFCCRMEYSSNSYQFLEEIPDYAEMMAQTQ